MDPTEPVLTSLWTSATISKMMSADQGLDEHTVARVKASAGMYQRHCLSQVVSTLQFTVQKRGVQLGCLLSNAVACVQLFAKLLCKCYASDQ